MYFQLLLAIYANWFQTEFSLLYRRNCNFEIQNVIGSSRIRLLSFEFIEIKFTLFTFVLLPLAVVVVFFLANSSQLHASLPCSTATRQSSPVMFVAPFHFAYTSSAVAERSYLTASNRLIGNAASATAVTTSPSAATAPQRAAAKVAYVAVADVVIAVNAGSISAHKLTNFNSCALLHCRATPSLFSLTCQCCRHT
uniref:Protein 4.1 n=1 Tax=Zeugodacus cucurbitae TaxID=28588 RepID=A0A0A1XF73_ZEUCU